MLQGVMIACHYFSQFSNFHMCPLVSGLGDLL